MLTKKEIYIKANKELENRRLISQQNQENNLRIAITICPEIKHLNEALKKTSIKIIKSIFNSNINKDRTGLILKIQNENLKTQQKIKTLLNNHNMSQNYLEIKPFCKLCNDYGIFKNEQCKCLKSIIKKIIIQDLQKNSCFKLSTFKDFDLNLYSKTEKTEKDITFQEHMKVILNICIEFTNNFPNVSYGLLMSGSTGLGKTHLSMAIASTLISKGFNVIYMTSTEITRKLFDIQFRKKTNTYDLDVLNLINESDLLIIDDLGSEFKSNFSVATIFEIVNNRTNLQKPIIFSTNLNLNEIEKLYGNRVFSRISANFKLLNFVGNDNRGINYKT